MVFPPYSLAPLLSPLSLLSSLTTRKLSSSRMLANSQRWRTHLAHISMLRSFVKALPSGIIFCLAILPIVTSFSTERLHSPLSRSAAASVDCNALRSGATSLRAAALSSPKTIQSTNVSNDLLGLLQQKALSSKADLDLDNEINSLVRTLIAAKSTFDPKECIDGPLFATIHFIGNTPLWEKIAIGGVRNVKGQRYTLLDDTSGNFVNYAEILGQALYLKAVGRFVEKGYVASSAKVDDKVGDTSNNPLEMLTSFFSSRDDEQKKPTPFDYEAIVSGVSIVLFGKYALNVDIAGTGTVRVLYADPNLRIFLSPTDTDVTRGAGDWESAGLIVVQVRNDLVYDDWRDQTLN